MPNVRASTGTRSSMPWNSAEKSRSGGSRSGALATVLDQIGFRVHVLEGGYREYRRAVTADLQQLPLRFGYRVVCGKTGSGKSRLLQALADARAQVLDLEALAEHRGSVLGLVPGRPQPSQKQFESRVWDTLRRLDPGRVVWVESESRKVGELRVPAFTGRIRVRYPIHTEREPDPPVIQLEPDVAEQVERVLRAPEPKPTKP